MNQRGIALPTALIVLTVLSALIVAFLVLAASEPQIAYNQMASAQARAVAETGVERALWALTKFDLAPGTAGALDGATTNPAPPPYDGSVFMQAGTLGVFKVTVSDGAFSNEKVVTAVGYVPTQNNPRSVKKIQVRVIKFKLLDPPCAMCAGGESPPGTDTDVTIGGNATIGAAKGASPYGASNYCPGVDPSSTIMSQGTVTTNGKPNLAAPDGTTDSKCTGSICSEKNPSSAFDSFTLKDADIAYLKSLAKTNGTYFQPPPGGDGKVTMTEPPKNGIVFVDTVSGNPLTKDSPSSDIPTLDIHGNWASTFKGWIVVAGSISIQGNISIDGLVYAQNDISLNGVGTGHITGAVVSTNRVDTSSTNIDSGDTGQAPLSYDCMAVRTGGGALPQGWTIEAGTYVEQQGS